MDNQQELIQKFLKFRRIAMIGVSRNPSDFTRKLWDAFLSKGYKVIPVNPLQKAVTGIKCYPDIQSVPQPVEGALILVPRDKVMSVLENCAEANVRTVWIYGIRGPKDISEDAIAFCDRYGIEIVAGYCPFMFLPKTSFPHRLHRLGWKLLGFYPG